MPYLPKPPNFPNVPKFPDLSDSPVLSDPTRIKPLYMTCGAGLTVLDFIFFMTLEAPSHLKGRDTPHPAHRGYVAVTVTADTPGTYMPLMWKIYIIREVMNLYPRNFLLCIPVFSEFYYLGAISLDNLVTSHATLYIGGPGDAGPCDVDMAKLALYLISAGMYLMAEVYWLNRLKVCS